MNCTLYKKMDRYASKVFYVYSGLFVAVLIFKHTRICWELMSNKCYTLQGQIQDFLREGLRSGKAKNCEAAPTSRHAHFIFDTLTHTPHPVPGPTTFDLLVTGLVDFMLL